MSTIDVLDERGIPAALTLAEKAIWGRAHDLSDAPQTGVWQVIDDNRRGADMGAKMVVSTISTRGSVKPGVEDEIETILGAIADSEVEPPDTPDVAPLWTTAEVINMMVGIANKFGLTIDPVSKYPGTVALQVVDAVEKMVGDLAVDMAKELASGYSFVVENVYDNQRETVARIDAIAKRWKQK